MLFLIPLVLGFAFNLASAFTGAYSRRWGEKCGSVITIIPVALVFLLLQKYYIQGILLGGLKE